MAASVDTLMPDLPGPDDESFTLMVGLLLEDVQQLNSRAKGKQHEGTVSDAELAIQLYAQELGNAAVFAADRRLTRSISEAMQTDANAIAHFNREERMARYDHDVSVALSEGLETPPAPRDMPWVVGNETNSDLPISHTHLTDEILHTDDDGDVVFLGYGHQGGQAESSSQAARRKPTRVTQLQQRDCTSCMEPKHVRQLVRAPCQHEYCHGCLLTLFRSAMTDESLFPPQCCRRPIPADLHQQVLGPSVINQFHEKEIEFSTANRTYCHSPYCAAFIYPGFCEDDVGLCIDCGSQTCVYCKRRAHPGDCPNDTELQRLLETARQEGWRRCFRCSSMVELNLGCFHITCRCRAEFCYQCGLEWKSCPCDQWDERRLLARAVQIDQRNNNHNQPALVPPPARPAQARPAQARPAQARPAQGLFELAARPQLLGGIVGGIEIPPVPAIVVDDSDDEDEDEHPPLLRLEPINRIMDNLRANHQCDHRDWQRMSGRHECESCNDVLPCFIYECSQCNILACRRCRYNRL
ncbi:RING finger protein [Xylariales sp. AK1849]|nr:RING finger protein [Xylariales sp. AK1849]